MSENERSGAVLGGLAGGLLGSQFGKGSGRLAATGIGAALGVMAGSAIGRSLDQRSQQLAANAVQQSYTQPVGSKITWNNPQNQSGPARGYVETIRDGNRNDGSYCREYQQTIIVGGKQQSAYGTACRKPDGNWELVNR